MLWELSINKQRIAETSPFRYSRYLCILFTHYELIQCCSRKITQYTNIVVLCALIKETFRSWEEKKIVGMKK